MPVLPKEINVPPMESQIQARHEYAQSPSAQSQASSDTGMQSPYPNITTTSGTDAILIPQITIKDALEAVPYFDGRSQSYRAFAEGCRSAKEMVPPRAEANLVKLIRNRLRGTAKDSVEGTSFLTIAALLEFLETLFSPPQSMSCLQGQLGRTIQLQNENVITYGTKVRHIYNLIIEAYARTTRQENPTFKKETEIEAIKCFRRGLKHGIHIGQPSAYGSLNEAIRAAIEAESEKELYDELHGRSHPLQRSITQWSRFQRNEPPPSNHSRPQNRSDNRQSSPSSKREANVNQIYSNPPVCSHCHRTGHRVENCWTKNGRPANTPPEPKQCRYCKNHGHTIDECRKKKYNDEKRSMQQGNGNTLPTTDARRKDSLPQIRVVSTEDSQISM